MQSFLRLIIAFLVLSSLSTSCKLSSNEKDQQKEASATTVTEAAPRWLKQSNVYEVNVRQYTREGTFKAFQKELPRLRGMGVDILWFMPITPISKLDRKGTLGSYYAVADYKGINPEFGTLEDFKGLVKNAHDLGFKVITDWVANHTGADHPWLTSHPDFFMLDSSGNAKYAFDWSDTRELNYDNRAMRDSMINSMKFWISETDIDGFRCDVAAEVPADFWKECIAELRKMKGIFMLAEADKGELHSVGFDASYAWDMFQTMKKVAAGERNALALDSVLMRQDSTFPQDAIRLYFTSNHDENSWNKSDYGTFPGAKHAPFAVLTQTIRGSLPLIYSGQEEPVLRKIEFFEKDPMQFGKYQRAGLYKALLNLRKTNSAFATNASFKKVKAGDDKAVYAFLRENGKNKVLVIANLSNNEQKITINENSLTGEPLNIFMGTREALKQDHSFNVEPWGYVIFDYTAQ